MNKRLNKRLLFCVLGGLGWFVLLAICESSLSGKHIWLIGAQREIESVRAGEKITHKAWLFNPTARTIAIRPEPTCGCTLSEMQDQALTPFNGIPLTVHVDTSGKAPGRHQERIELIMRSDEGSWREQVNINYSVVASQKKEVSK
jgi:hypothetical protein